MVLTTLHALYIHGSRASTRFLYIDICTTIQSPTDLTDGLSWINLDYCLNLYSVMWFCVAWAG